MKDFFQNKVAIVTGGGTGIGKALSCLLAQSGTAVAVVYSRSEQEAQNTVAEIQAQGGLAKALKADVSQDDQVQAMVQTVVETYGGVDYLVNNAGITRQKLFDDLDAVTDGDWDQLFAVNVKGAFHCCRAAATYLRQRKGAAIVNVGSIAGETGYGSSLPYAVSKAAMHGMTKSLARALAPHVRVNCIAPGAVETRWWAGHEEKMQKLAGQVALERFSTPADIARSILLLLASESLTGQILCAENGQTL